MPELRSTNLSHESLAALMDALGFEDMQNPHEELKTNDYPDMANDPYQSQRSSSSFSSTLEWLPSEADESIFVGQDYSGVYDFGSDFDEDSSDCDFDDTLPSRPGSTVDSFEMVCTPTANHGFPPSFTQPPPATPPPSATKSITPKPLTLHLQQQRQFQPGSSTKSPTPSTLSFQSSSYTDSPPPSPSNTIYVKAAHNASIIMIRAPRTISFQELKQRLYEKFVKQEGILLSHSFSVVNVLPPTAPRASTSSWSATGPSAARPLFTRSRSGSSASMLTSTPIERRPSLGPRRVSFAERTEMRFIDQEMEWRRVVSTHSQGAKITLRILDTPS